MTFVTNFELFFLLVILYYVGMAIKYLVAILVITPIVEILILAARQLNQLSSDPRLTERKKKEESAQKRR
jgi:hypothetical protein